MMWISVTASPRLASPHAASTPSSPPPITTARDPGSSPLQDAHIVEIAEGENAREDVSGHRQPDGLGARRQHEPVVAEPRTVGEHDLLPRGPQSRSFHAAKQQNALLAVPGRRPQLDVGVLRLAGQQARQQHPVVGRMRFLRRDHDLVAAGALLDEFLDQLEGRHPAANDQQPLAPPPIRYRSGSSGAKTQHRVVDLRWVIASLDPAYSAACSAGALWRAYRNSITRWRHWM